MQIIAFSVSMHQTQGFSWRGIIYKQISHIPDIHVDEPKREQRTLLRNCLPVLYLILTHVLHIRWSKWAIDSVLYLNPKPMAPPFRVQYGKGSFEVADINTIIYTHSNPKLNSRMNARIG